MVCSYVSRAKQKLISPLETVDSHNGFTAHCAEMKYLILDNIRFLIKYVIRNS